MAIHSKLAVIKLDNAAGSLTTISTYCDSCETPNELGEVEVTTFGNTREQFIPGFASGTVSLGGPWTRAQHVMFAALREGYEAGTLTSSSFEYGPEGVDSGDVKEYGEVVMTSYSGAIADVGDALKWTAEFRVNSYATSTY